MNESPALADRLRRIFAEEMADHLEVLEAGVGRLASGESTGRASTVAEMFRAAHSLKGAAAAVGAATVSARCHDLEEQLAALRDATEPAPGDLDERLARLVEAVTAAGQEWRRPRAQRGSASSSPGPGSGPTHPRGRRGTVRVPADVLDAVLAQTADLVTVANRSGGLAAALAGLADEMGDSASALRRDLRSLSRQDGSAPRSQQLTENLERLGTGLDRLSLRTGQLSHTVTADVHELWALTRALSASTQAARAVPFTDATVSLAQVVRSAAEQSGKQARLVVDAAEVRLDKDLVAVLQNVLGHLVRNAVDHGLEQSAHRRARGKDPVGLVRVTARLRGDGLQVVVRDDGQGVRADLLREAARRHGRQMDDADVEAMAFEPGVTTAASVTQASGRGVGLDAVRGAVESVGGSVNLRSSPGSGVEVAVVLPLTTSSLRVLLVRVGDRVVALPTASLERIVAVGEEGATVSAASGMVTVGDQPLPLVPLHDALGWEPDTARPSTPWSAIVLRGAHGAGLLVEEVLEEREVVLSTSPSRLAGVGVLLGTARLDDGSLVLVLSAPACVRAARARPPRPGKRPTGEEPSPPARRILVVEDTITTRELERGILEAAGYSVVVADDGLRAWRLLQDTVVDAVVSDVTMPRMDGLALCRAVRGASELAHLPVVLVSSLDSEEDRRAAAEAGADAYLTKQDFDRQELLTTLERLL